MANRFIRNEQEWEPVGPAEGGSTGDTWIKSSGLNYGEDGFMPQRSTRAQRLLQLASEKRLKKLEAIKNKHKHENSGGVAGYVWDYGR